MIQPQKSNEHSTIQLDTPFILALSSESWFSQNRRSSNFKREESVAECRQKQTHRRDSDSRLSQKKEDHFPEEL